MTDMAALPVPSFPYTGGELVVTEAMKTAYNRDGFLHVTGLWDKEELGIFEEALGGTDGLSNYAYGLDDGEGKVSKMCLWSYPGSDTTGTFCRTRKMAATAESLLGGPCYHYHSKLMMKEAFSGGKFQWHQDYGYWYNFAFLYPDMLTAFIAIDGMDMENGCLQVIRGSHRCGRITHGPVAGHENQQYGADMERVREVQKRLPTMYLPLEAGDAVFFHCNLLHSSSQNPSSRRRWALLSCYSRADNGPYKKVICAEYQQPIDMVDNDAVIKQGVNRDLKGKEVYMSIDDEYKVVIQ